MSLSNRDIEDLKGLLNDTVKKFLGFSEPSVVSAALNCISTGIDKRKTVDKLSLILDGEQASTLTDKVFHVYDDFRQGGRAAKKRRRDAEDEHMKRRRFLDDEDIPEVAIPAPVMNLTPAKPKLINTLPNLDPSAGGLTPDKIKEMMANAQKLIQERKAQLQASVPQSASQPGSGGGLLPTPNMQQQQHHPKAPLPQPQHQPADKAQQVSELQARIKARLSGLAGSLPMPAPAHQHPPVAPHHPPPAPPPLIPGLQGAGQQQQQQQQQMQQQHNQQQHHHLHHQQQQQQQQQMHRLPPTHNQPLAGPSPLILNAEGKTIDAKTGEAVQLTLYTPTLKANIRAKRREQFKGLIDKPPEEISESKYFDPRVSLKATQRPKRGFKFHEKGKFELQASRLRAKAQLERLQTEISHAAKKTGIASAAKIATITPKKEFKEGEIPDIEWWDTYIVRRDSYDTIPDDVDIGRDVLDGVTNLVEHPTQMKPPVEAAEEAALPIYLTKGERKKLRRQNRREAEKEVQEKIKMGLAPPLEPKVRLANLMRVLGTEAVQDPTKVEAHVRAQMAKRQRAHEEANAARKLTVEQRKEKKVNKIKEDTSTGVHVSVYRVRDLSDAAVKFKIEKNATQLYMTGITILHKDCNVVVVEGGPKQQRKFRRLMMHRIKWEEAYTKRSKDKAADSDSDDDDNEDKVNKCFLVWEGMVKTRDCGEMRLKACPTPSFAREQLKKLGLDHYWDLAFSGAVLDTAGPSS